MFAHTPPETAPVSHHDGGAQQQAAPARSGLVWHARSRPLPAFPRRLVLLGATGSIGTSSLQVAEALPDRLHVVGLSAHQHWHELFCLAERFRPRWLVVTDPDAWQAARGHAVPPGCQLLFGQEGIRQMVTAPEVDMVVAGIVGAAGLPGTLAALEAGKVVALANKETLVVAGELVARILQCTQAVLLPIDSEHSALFQLLQREDPCHVRRVILTASGGPFRNYQADQLVHVTSDQALAHPTWRMGRKISVDSATLMNKALEVIEAHWLFGVSLEQIQVLIHPESIVHALVEMQDGTLLAHLSCPDMRLPIQYALTYPERLPGPARGLNVADMTALHFEPPDTERFPALELGYTAARKGGTAGAVLNAANEVAVSRFLSGSLRFVDIARVCGEVLGKHRVKYAPSLGDLLAADRWARQEVAQWHSSSDSGPEPV